MKAALHKRYGPPDVIQILETEMPVPKNSEVLLRVRAAAVNPLDWHGLRGSPYIMRLGGLRRPKDPRMGFDVAGRVEAVGKDVSRLKPGDEVFGTCRGAFAEYACAAESALAPKPENVSFEQAAAAPVAALTALQALRDKGRIQPGQRVLINGGAGGVGSFAVQIARFFGAELTAVCSTRNLEMVRSLGANRVIDYAHEDFTKEGPSYDLLLDCVGNRSLLACRRVLIPKGVLVAVTGPDGPWLGPVARFIQALLVSFCVSQTLTPFITKPAGDDLIIIAGLMASGKVRPVIDRNYPLTEVPDALRYVEKGHTRGKIVITM